MRKDRKLPSQVSGMFITAETVGNKSTPVDEYCVQLYYASLDQMIGEMHTRFAKLNLSLVKAMQALSPQSTVFLDYKTLIPFLGHYNLSSDEVKVELLQQTKCYRAAG